MRLPIQILAIIYRMNNGTPEFLLFKRVPEKGGFWLSVSGGYEETDGSLLDTCYRELEEETAIKKADIVTVHERLHIYQFTEQIKNKENTNYKTLNTDSLTLTTFTFGFEVKQGVEPELLEEHTEYKWVTAAEAATLLKYAETIEGIQVLNEKVRA
jgi:8-oxo-dGTP pyrophosphatase MutT (NUDIX family)